MGDLETPSDRLLAYFSQSKDILEQQEYPTTVKNDLATLRCQDHAASTIPHTMKCRVQCVIRRVMCGITYY